MLENKNYNDDIDFDVYNPSILLCKNMFTQRMLPRC
jgi:hypothetical protein